MGTGSTVRLGYRVKSQLYRFFTICCAWMLFYTSASPALNATAISLFKFLEAHAQLRPGPFTETPRPIYKGTNPKREPKTRGGMWSPQALRDAELSKFKNLYASTELPPPPQHTLSVDADPGEAMPWEGSAPTAGGSVNSGNGNKLTAIPLVSWKDRGGMEVDFTLYHNRQVTGTDRNFTV